MYGIPSRHLYDRAVRSGRLISASLIQLNCNAKASMARELGIGILVPTRVGTLSILPRLQRNRGQRNSLGKVYKEAVLGRRTLTYGQYCLPFVLFPH